MIRLHHLDPKEVSLVKRGANRKKFLIFKSAEGQTHDLPPTSQSGASMTIKELIQSVGTMDAETHGRVDAAIAKIAKSDGEGTAGEGGMSPAAQAAMKAVAKILAPFKGEITDADLDTLQAAIGMAPEMDAAEENELEADELADDGSENSDEFVQMLGGGGTYHPPADANKSDKGEKMADDMDVEMSSDAPEGVDPKVHADAMDKAKMAYADHMKKMQGSKAPAKKAADAEETCAKEDKDMAKTDVGKSANDRVAAILKSHQALADANEQLIRKSAKLEADLKIERDIRLKKEFIQKAQSFPNLGADTNELAEVLKGFHDRGDTAGLAQLESVLKAASNQAGAAQRFGGDLYSEMGSDLGRGGRDPEAEIEAHVQSIVAKSSGVSHAKAYSDFLATPEGSKLYAEQKALHERKGSR